jgi:hypothetical protein
VKPRLTIVVPYCQNESEFDSTLVSVLENRPPNSEVMVAHDGSYRDPFDLGDEVRFVTVENEPSLVGLLDSAIQQSRGSTIHFLFEGNRATPGWTDEPIELLEQQHVGSVSPLAYDLGDDEHIVAAGWTADRFRIYRPLAAGSRKASSAELAKVMGPYLCASFWRRDCIAACLEAGTGQCPQSAQLAIGYAMKACELECRVATSSMVVGCTASFQSPVQGKVACATQTIRMAALRQGPALSVLEALLGFAPSAASLAGWKRTAGRLTAALTGAKQAAEVRKQLRIAQEIWQELDAPVISVLPMRDVQYGVRRAA